MDEQTFDDRYHAAGLRRNPFVAPPLGAPACSAFVSRGLPSPPPPGSRTLVQVIGPSGYGKTSQVEHWRSATPGPYHYVPKSPYRDRWVSPPLPGRGDAVFYGDEIDRMPSPLRRRWFGLLAAASATLVIGTHVDLTHLGRRAGLTVITHRLAPLDRDGVRRMVEANLDSVATRPTKRIGFTPDEIEQILRESGGVPEEIAAVCHRLLAERLR